MKKLLVTIFLSIFLVGCDLGLPSDLGLPDYDIAFDEVDTRIDSYFVRIDNLNKGIENLIIAQDRQIQRVDSINAIIKECNSILDDIINEY